MAVVACALLLGCAIDTAGLRPADAGGRRDARGGDAQPPVDAPDAPDAPGARDAGTGPCASRDADTIALWDFESGLPTVLRDVAGGHDGSGVRGPMAVDGPEGCGTALGLGGSEPPAYGVIPDSTDFHLAMGSIDLWVRYDGDLGLASDPPRGILSRDATGKAPGHFTLLLAGNGVLIVRVQTTGAEVVLCSDSPVTPSTWTHVGVLLGAPEVELWVDGRLQTRTGFVTGRLALGACGETFDTGIAGNANPWVFGAGSWESAEGTGAPLAGYLAPAALDHVRISSVRRDFAW